jgi:hypothetical protein
MIEIRFHVDNPDSPIWSDPVKNRIESPALELVRQ